MTQRLAAVLLASALAGLLPACQRDLPPDATYRALVRAVAERDESAAWNLLSSATQKRLEEKARVAAAAAPGVVPASARAMLVGRRLPVRPSALRDQRGRRLGGPDRAPRGGARERPPRRGPGPRGRRLARGPAGAVAGSRYPLLSKPFPTEERTT